MEFSDDFESSFREAFGAGLPPAVVDKILADIKVTAASAGSGSTGFDKYVQRAVDDALNHVLLETFCQTRRATSAFPSEAPSGARRNNSYASAAAQPAASASDGTVQSVILTRKINKKKDRKKVTGVHEADATLAEQEAFSTLRVILPADIDDFTLMETLRKHGCDVTAAVNALCDAVSPPVPRTPALGKKNPPTTCPINTGAVSNSIICSAGTSVLSLLTDEKQLSAFQALRSMLPPEFEDWYLLDTLMTYNFNVSDTVNMIFEENGRAKMTYNNVVSRGFHGKSIKPTNAESSLVHAVKKSFTISPVTERENIVTPPQPSVVLEAGGAPHATILMLDPFQWRRAMEAANEAQRIFSAQNPHLIASVDSCSGQLLFAGLRDKPTSKSIRSQKVVIDFHHSTVKVALEITRSALIHFAKMRRAGSASPNGISRGGDLCPHSSPRCYMVELLFGLGTHSYAGRCVLQVAVCSFLDRRGVSHEMSTGGASTVIKI